MQTIARDSFSHRVFSGVQKMFIKYSLTMRGKSAGFLIVEWLPYHPYL